MPCFKLKLFSFTAIKWLFLTLYFEILIDLQKVAKIVQRGPAVPFNQLSPVLRSYMAMVQYQNQDVGIGAACLADCRPCSDFIHVYACGEEVKESSVQFYHVCVSM